MTRPATPHWGPAEALEHALTVGSNTHDRRFHGGTTCAIFAGVCGEGQRPGGERVVKFLTDIGSFLAVGSCANMYDRDLVGRFIYFTWIREGGSRATRDAPIALTAPPQHPKPSYLTWPQHLAAERTLAQREEADASGNQDAVRAHWRGKCPLCGQTVVIGDPILACFEGWAHARCATKHQRNPPTCPLCHRPVLLHQEAHHQSRGDAHMECVVGPRAAR